MLRGTRTRVVWPSWRSNRALMIQTMLFPPAVGSTPMMFCRRRRACSMIAACSGDLKDASGSLKAVRSVVRRMGEMSVDMALGS